MPRKPLLFAGGAILAALLLLGLLAVFGGKGSEADVLAEAVIAEQDSAPFPLFDGAEWTLPVTDETGEVPALENDWYALYLNPANTQITLTDKRSGYRWRSNPTEAEVQKETVKGQLLSNLKSPFILTYVKTEGRDQTMRETLNALDPHLQLAFHRTSQKLQVQYTFTDKQLQFALQYELTPRGMKVSLPAEGVAENGGYAIFAIDVLPFFGGSQADEDGYLFVPDGPGGLIYFKDKNINISKGYAYQTYGTEITNQSQYNRSGQRREDIAYPVFGMKRNDQGYVAILTEGGETASIAALPPGLKSSLFNVYASQIYRQEYMLRTSRMTAPVKTVQKQPLLTDRVIEYRFLHGEDAGYVGMAQEYRRYLQQSGRLGERLSKVENVPLQLKLMGGNAQQAYNRMQYVPVTTFEQAGDIVAELRERGILNMNIIYYGWNQNGDYAIAKRFPVEAKLGGEEGARQFIEQMHQFNYKVLFENDFVWIDAEPSGMPGRLNGIRGLDETVFTDSGWYLSKPQLTVEMAVDTIGKLEKLGADGILFNMLGETILQDYDPNHRTSRGETAAIYRGLLNYARQTLGMSGVYRGNAYTLGAVDYISLLPAESSYDFIIDETVPFYPIALHGYINYSFEDGNLRDDMQGEFLRAIEYGALPSFFLSRETSRKLRNTSSSFLYSSEYDKWAERAVQEYEQFNRLKTVYYQTIVGHERLSEQKYATTYEDGTRVIVDYGSGTFDIRQGEGL